MPNHIHYTHSKVKNQQPGYVNRAWLAPLAWMDFVALPEDSEQPWVIQKAHVFGGGLGFLECYTLPRSNEAQGSSVSEPGALHPNWTHKFFVPGDGPEVQTFVLGMKNEPLMLIVEGAEGVLAYQYGTKKNPAYYNSYQFSSGNQYEGKKGWEINVICNNRYFYTNPLLYRLPDGSLPSILINADGNPLLTDDDKVLLTD